MKTITWGIILILIYLSVVAGYGLAQDECPSTVDEAVEVIDSICNTLGRNEACYGNGKILATLLEDATGSFRIPGDFVEISAIETLNLSPLDNNLMDWGIAVLLVQADIPDTLPGQNVTLLLFGDVALENEDNAFYFSSGAGIPNCITAPDGMLIRTPEGVGEVNLVLNGIEISLGSTLFVQNTASDVLDLALLDGQATLTVDGTSVTLIPNQSTSIKVDDTLTALGTFTAPQPIAPEDMVAIPTTILDAVTDTSSDDPLELIAIAEQSADDFDMDGVTDAQDTCIGSSALCSTPVVTVTAEPPPTVVSTAPPSVQTGNTITELPRNGRYEFTVFDDISDSGIVGFRFFNNGDGTIVFEAIDYEADSVPVYTAVLGVTQSGDLETIEPMYACDAGTTCNDFFDWSINTYSENQFTGIIGFNFTDDGNTEIFGYDFQATWISD